MDDLSVPCSGSIIHELVEDGRSEYLDIAAATASIRVSAWALLKSSARARAARFREPAFSIGAAGVTLSQNGGRRCGILCFCDNPNGAGFGHDTPLACSNPTWGGGLLREYRGRSKDQHFSQARRTDGRELSIGIFLSSCAGQEAADGEMVLCGPASSE